MTRESDFVDLEVDDNGVLVFYDDGPRFVSGLKGVAQRIRIALRLIFAEWSMDQTIGMKWYTELLGDASKGNDRNAKLRSAITAEILLIEDVVSVTSISFTPTPTKRKISVAASVKTVFGTTTVAV